MDEQNQQNEQKSPFDSLKPIYQEAIELKLQGMAYKVIADTLSQTGFKVKEHTLRVWFMQGGICHAIYNSMQEARRAQLQQETREMSYRLQEAARDALGTLEAAILGDTKITPLRAKVAMDILDRAGYPRQSSLQTNTTIEVSKQEELSEMSKNIRAILENRKPLPRTHN